MLEKLYLKDYRNFIDKLFEFSPDTTVIIGPNASGKTNILESIHLLSTGKSFRATREEEMINYESELARAKAKLNNIKLEVILTRGQMNMGTKKTKHLPKKRLLLDGTPKRLGDFIGNLKSVLFSPEDMDLIIESPSIRRRFLDQVLSQVDREYARSLLSYEKGLRRRNKLLWRIREHGASRNYLTFWDKLLIKNGDYINTQRRELLDFIDNTDDFNGQDFSVSYDQSAISEARLEQYKDEEVAAATTLVGPHRDDFCVRIKKHASYRDLDKYGSRGEQRMGVLWLKLAQLAFIEKTTQEKPLLLLDDIFSELDKVHRSIVHELSKSQQTIITTADLHFVKDMKNIAKINIK